MNNQQCHQVQAFTTEALTEISQSLETLQSNLLAPLKHENHTLYIDISQQLLIIKAALERGVQKSNVSPLPVNQLFFPHTQDTLSAVIDTLLFVDDYFHYYSGSGDTTINKATYNGLRYALIHAVDALNFEAERYKKPDTAMTNK